jgi:hypothetical protein
MNQPFDLTTLLNNSELQLNVGLVFSTWDDAKTNFRAYAEQQLFDMVGKTTNNGVNTSGKWVWPAFVNWKNATLGRTS